MCIFWHNWQYSTFDIFIEAGIDQEITTLIYRTCFHCLKTQLWEKNSLRWYNSNLPQQDVLDNFEKIHEGLMIEFENQGLDFSVSLNDKNDSLIVSLKDKTLCKIDRKILKTKHHTKQLWVFSYLNVTSSHDLKWIPFHNTGLVWMKNWCNVIKQKVLNS